MTNKQRTDLIERFIRAHKYADLRTLATRFSSSLSTVRRALDQLEANGVVRRHHGGASLVETDVISQEYDFNARDLRFPDEKFAIASLVAKEVKPGMTVIFDGGSTSYAVARLVVDKRLQVITNSLPVASLFSDVGNVEITVTGGTIYNRLGVALGPMCEDAFSQVHADIAVLGGMGITEKGIWNHNSLMVAAQRKMIAAAERCVFALDNSKFGRKALNLATAFDPRFTIITNPPPPPLVSKAIRNAKARLVLTRR